MTSAFTHSVFCLCRLRLHFRSIIAFTCECVCVCLPHMQVPTEARRGCWIHLIQFQEVVSCSSWVLRTRLRSCGGTVPVDPSLQSRLPRPSSYSSSVISTQVGFLCLLFPFSGNVHWLGLQLSSMSFFSYWIVYPIQK